jgi:leucyl aminopeptidase
MISLRKEKVMIFSIATDLPTAVNTACVVVPVFEIKNSHKLPTHLEMLDTACDGYISELIKVGDLNGKFGQCLLLLDLDNVQTERVMIIGCGNKPLDHADLKKLVQIIFKTAENANIKDLTLYLLDLVVKTSLGEVAIEHKIRNIVTSFNECIYSFQKYKKSEHVYKPTEISIYMESSQDYEHLELALDHAQQISLAAQTVKDLANTPPNICTPVYLAKYCQDLNKRYEDLNVAILTQDELIELGMGAFASVGQGSENESRLISIAYSGADKSQAPIVFIGKGITFDTGGNSLKQPASMIGMKYDMCGAATVIGLLEFVAQAQLPLNVIGLLATAENMPGSKASRPEDIVTTMSGKTVEILNTDAEGRLVLCDTLTYAERFNPDVVIDIATLTGACVVALGNYHAGLLSNHQALANDLLKAGIQVDDKCWQLPLTKEYHKQLESKFADMTNVGGPDAGTITAACFLQKFAEKFNWAHLDIAGVAATYTGKERGASARPLYMLTEYLLARCN